MLSHARDEREKEKHFNPPENPVRLHDNYAWHSGMRRLIAEEFSLSMHFYYYFFGDPRSRETCCIIQLAASETRMKKNRKWNRNSLWSMVIFAVYTTHNHRTFLRVSNENHNSSFASSPFIIKAGAVGQWRVTSCGQLAFLAQLQEFSVVQAARFLPHRDQDSAKAHHSWMSTRNKLEIPYYHHQSNAEEASPKTSKKTRWRRLEKRRLLSLAAAERWDKKLLCSRRRRRRRRRKHELHESFSSTAASSSRRHIDSLHSARVFHSKTGKWSFVFFAEHLTKLLTHFAFTHDPLTKSIEILIAAPVALWMKPQ